MILAPASSAGVFKFMPRYRAQVPGSSVYYNHHLKVESSAVRGNYLHVTPDTPYQPVPDPTDLSLPKCLRTSTTNEVNLSTSFSTFTVRLRYRVDAQRQGLLTGAPFRLYNPQTEAFVQASANPEKGRLVGSGLPPATREGGLRMHLPYLKPLERGGNGASAAAATAEPADPANQNGKQLWCVEPLSRSVATVAGWAMDVRLRHVGSGKYLAVNTDAPPVALEKRKGETPIKVFAPYLCDDAYPPGYDFSSSHLVAGMVAGGSDGGGGLGLEAEAERQTVDGDASGALDLAWPANMVFKLKVS